MAITFRLQRRLAASILKVGKNRVWLDPTEQTEIAQAGSRAAIRRLVQSGYIIAKRVAGYSRIRVNKYREARRLGRHRGTGKRRGTAEARSPTKKAWMTRLRILRKVLKKFRDAKKIDNSIYHSLYARVKGNIYKNRRVLLEAIFKMKADQSKERQLAYQLEARKAKKLELETKKSERQAKKAEAPKSK